MEDLTLTYTKKGGLLVLKLQNVSNYFFKYFNKDKNNITLDFKNNT